MGLRSVVRYVGELQDAGRIEATHPGRGRHNRYYLPQFSS
jgi:hypothetical protein